MVNNTITVFEHSKLRIDEQGFREHHFNALVKFNELHGNKYFTPGYRKIIFNSYVGVIQAGDKVIEILPKADNLPVNEQRTKAKWQSALLYMLKRAGYIKLNNTEKAQQQSQSNTLLDIYLYTFLKEVEGLIHAGLVKKYHKVKTNGVVMKGRLLIERQIQHNTIHKERFFTEHTIYDRNNIFNAILKAALEIIQKRTVNYGIKQLAAKQLLSFEGINKWSGEATNFEKIKFDRKTSSYQYAIELARMIILNYCPDMAAGNNSVLAILFDMNTLFERFIYRELKREEKNFSDYCLHIQPQNKKRFWKNKTIRPDMVISFRKQMGAANIKEYTTIVDTKWKIVAADSPSDDDLKQMFAYNFQFGSSRSVLLYPHVNQSASSIQYYTESKAAPAHLHGCEMFFSYLFSDKSLSINKSLGKEFIEHVLFSKD
ncbi:MAG: restriction endonuclease [Bacteroidetes bacterium]|nr:restriction endonuclease [Bacteroidota bacterium]